MSRSINEPVCIGCPDPARGQTYSFCLVHGRCVGCPNPRRGDVTKGDLSRACPVHGVVAEDQRAALLGREASAPARLSPT
jgi:hypothetical protein